MKLKSAPRLKPIRIQNESKMSGLLRHTLQTLRQRSLGVDIARERVQFAAEDRASSAVEAKLRDPEGTKADVEGKARTQQFHSSNLNLSDIERY